MVKSIVKDISQYVQNRFNNNWELNPNIIKEGATSNNSVTNNTELSSSKINAFLQKISTSLKGTSISFK